MIGTSFKDALEFARNPAGLFPRRWSLVNYQVAFTQIRNLPIYMRNSFILAFGTVTLQVFVCSLAGYAFARMNFRYRDLIFLAILISMFIPRSGGLMALYELMNFLKLRNSLLGLILFFSASIPVPTFIMRQSFLGIPREIKSPHLLMEQLGFRFFGASHFLLPLAAL